MREGPAILTRRQDYAAPAFWIRRADLVFDLDPAKTIVSSKLLIERNPSAPEQPLKLHGEDITPLRVMAGGESLAFRHEDGMLVIGVRDEEMVSSAFALEYGDEVRPPTPLFRSLTEDMRDASEVYDDHMKSVFGPGRLTGDDAES